MQHASGASSGEPRLRKPPPPLKMVGCLPFTCLERIAEMSADALMPIYLSCRTMYRYYNERTVDILDGAAVSGRRLDFAINRLSEVIPFQSGHVYTFRGKWHRGFDLPAIESHDGGISIVMGIHGLIEGITQAWYVRGSLARRAPFVMSNYVHMYIDRTGHIMFTVTPEGIRHRQDMQRKAKADQRKQAMLKRRAQGCVD